MFVYFYHFVIGTGLSLSLFSLHRKKGREQRIQKVIVFILFLVLFMELAGSFTAQRGINNSLLYNIGWVYVESILLIYYFYLLELSQDFKKKILWTCNGILVWGIINTVYFQSLTTEFQFFTFLPFALLIIFLVFRFLINLIQMKTYADRDLIQLPHFWISWAILLFYIEAIFLFGTFQFNPEFVLAHMQLLFTINQLVAGLMYLVFGLAFLLPWLYRKRVAFIE